MEEKKDITITYETLFEVLKRERDLTDLQKLSPTFYSDFIVYFQEKQKMLEKDDPLFSYEEKKKTEKQIENARRLIKEIYDRREKKVMNFAIMKSRIKANIMDTSSMLEMEKVLFERAAAVLSAFRENVANNLIVGREPFIPNAAAAGELPSPKEKPRMTKLVRFLHPVPQFVGEELEEYGPFSEEDIANLPRAIADLLLDKGKVEEIKG